ncbi:hypothetical protein MNBD_GAMMA12-3935 [hydrothermal vent metagenome]|uniref:HTH arsR-type domain-containing protein n=1 Tax=hydrothermal vent metagenome TaxID=652676 RepID=A0A3B0YTP0_9ZZZZ
MNTEKLAALFKTLSEPVRLRIVYLLLRSDEICVCDLVDTLSLSQSVVSRHLAYLRNNGLVSTRRDSVWVYYKIINNCCVPLLEHIRESGRNNNEMQKDLLKLNSFTKKYPC